MPPALSDLEDSDLDDGPMTNDYKREASFDDAPEDELPEANSSPKRRVANKVKAEEDATPIDIDDEEEEEEEEDEDDDVFVVEAIRKHMIDEDGTIKFQVKWEGYDKKSDMTWEPEDNLREDAGEILQTYLAKVGGRDAILEETQTASRGKKRGRQPGSTAGSGSKRSRKNGVHPGDTTPPATAKAFQPPSGQWEDAIEKIDQCEHDDQGRLMVYLVWKDGGHRTKHAAQVIYRKAPQKMLQYYERHVRIIKDEDK